MVDNRNRVSKQCCYGLSALSTDFRRISNISKLRNTLPRNGRPTQALKKKEEKKESLTRPVFSKALWLLLTSRAATTATPKYCKALWELLPLK